MSAKAEMSFTKWVKQEWKKPGDAQPTIEAEYIVPVEKKGNDCMFDFMNAKPLIRCKDCKFYEVAELNYDGTPDKRCKPSICANGWYEYAVERDPNWFCADAERKETE